MTDKQNSTEMAQDRTDWAEDRTILANERTFAGWMRTGMACVALALGLRAVFGAFEPTWVPKAVSQIFIFAALAIFYASWRNSSKAQKRIDDHATESQDHRNFAIIAAILSFGAIATGAILWFL